MHRYSFYDFFAGGGMVGIGLGSEWSCLFANDIDAKKADSYRTNHSDDHNFLLKDVAELKTTDLPDHADLIWASFPCQDLSVAGKGAGLAGERSGTFKPFWNLVTELSIEDRCPKMIVLENVCGTLTSNGGRDFATLAQALSDLDYKFGAVVIDAVHFLPQSRPRFFMIAFREGLNLNDNLICSGPNTTWHSRSLVEGYNLLPESISEKWVWWNLPVPAVRNVDLISLIENNPSDVEWHTQEQTQKILNLMTPQNLEKVSVAKLSNSKMVGTIYKRTRVDTDGIKKQRAEVRFDQVAGCLRTPSGGSSRQTIMLVDGDEVRTRLLSKREAARLMGLPDEYKLPVRYNEAYKLAGDGVAVPVVRFLSQSLLEPILDKNRLALVA
ncbi:DNA (cytosine-5-)-methyltransferase [Paracoccaceae bacterium]|nr:DNA (cytosine-5-)-methyltransferase [Paracoccaceae bacterium]